jgi:hypothetical protein
MISSSPRLRGAACRSSPLEKAIIKKGPNRLVQTLFTSSLRLPFADEISYCVEQIDAEQGGIQQNHGPRVAQRRVDHAYQGSAHVDDAQLYHRGHHHRNDNQRRSDIPENFKKYLVIFNEKFHTNLQKLNLK